MKWLKLTPRFLAVLGMAITFLGCGMAFLHGYEQAPVACEIKYANEGDSQQRIVKFKLTNSLDRPIEIVGVSPHC